MNHEALTLIHRQPPRSLLWFLLALSACTPDAKPGADQALDLGGGISMSPAGEIRGATPGWASDPPGFVGEPQQAAQPPSKLASQAR